MGTMAFAYPAIAGNPPGIRKRHFTRHDCQMTGAEAANLSFHAQVVVIRITFETST
jgi:hypothetical protein